MFRKLLSNLPYSPGLLNTVVFYAERLRRENVSRQVGVAFLGVAFSVQLLFWLVPPLSSVQASSNDIVWGGIGTNFEQAKARMLQVYREDRDSRNVGGFQDLFHGAFGVTEQDLLNAEHRKINVTDPQWKSLGRHPKFSAAQGEVQIRTPGGAIFYLRPSHLWPWAYPNRDALYLPSKDLYILWDCGNFVTNKVPTPQVTIDKTASPAAGSKVKPGDNITYTLTYRNTGNGSAAGAVVKDATPNHMYRRADQVDDNPDQPVKTVHSFLGESAVEYFYWYRSVVLPGASEQLRITFTVKSDAPNGAEICNRAAIEFHTGNARAPIICHTVEVPPTPPPPQEPEAPAQAPPEQPDVSLFKRAENLSAPEDDPRRDDAQAGLAQAGDKIRYTLSLTNNGQADIASHVIEPEDITDILDYVDEKTGLIDLGSATFDDINKHLTWEPAPIKAGETIERSFTVQIKSPIPSTPQGYSDRSQFDLVMTNVYGNVVQIKLPGAPDKIIEQTTTTLPRTGPGTTVAVSLAFIGTAVFIRSRNGLLVRELDLVKQEQLVG